MYRISVGHIQLRFVVVTFQNKLVIMHTNVQPVVIANIVHLSDHGLSQQEMSRNIRVPRAPC